MSRSLPFEKLHGAGNDFVFFEDLEDSLSLDPQQVISLCDRHFGIGADGVIIVKPPQDDANAAFMHYINSDGTIAEMCGNGIRCFAKYLVDHKLIPQGTPLISVETRAGVKTISYTADADGNLVTATVDMGMPELNPQKVPTSLAFNAITDFGEVFVKDSPIDSPFGTFEFSCVSMGNPHAITFVDDLEAIDVNKIGAYFESCDVFPEKVNVEFASIEDDGIHMRVFERGCGETYACGTGACAVNVAAFLTKRAGKDNDVILRGGTLNIAYTPSSSVMMTGPAQVVFTGQVTL